VSSLFQVLANNHPDGNFNEEDLWNAIAEANDLDVNVIMDGDLAEWL
jgi:hypothetical protein